jgi:hypothetical protein
MRRNHGNSVRFSISSTPLASFSPHLNHHRLPLDSNTRALPCNTGTQFILNRLGLIILRHLDKGRQPLSRLVRIVSSSVQARQL